MNDKAYSAFHENVEVADSDPVRFQFTSEEVDEFQIEGGHHRTVMGDAIFNLSERGYPYIRSALIFELIASERLK